MIRSGMLVARAHTCYYLSLPSPSWRHTTIYLDYKTGSRERTALLRLLSQCQSSLERGVLPEPSTAAMAGRMGTQKLQRFTFLAKPTSLFLTICCPSSYRRLHSQICQVSKVASLPTLNMSVHLTQINSLEEASQVEKAYGYC